MLRGYLIFQNNFGIKKMYCCILAVFRMPDNIEEISGLARLLSYRKRRVSYLDTIPSKISLVNVYALTGVYQYIACAFAYAAQGIFGIRQGIFIRMHRFG